MRLPIRIGLLVLAAAMALSACGGSEAYRSTAQGKFQGDLDVRWVRNDFFLFVPSKDNPLTFTRANGRKITPGVIYTDGGSIPQFLWGVKGFSPWGYAPAYVIHDWLFEAQHCKYEPDKQFTFGQAADVLAEGLKTIMEADTEVKNYFVFDSVYLAVQSPIARKRWDEGECKPLADTLTPGGPLGELIMTIRFR